MNVATFNVRGLELKDNVKLDNLIKDCRQYKVDLLAIQETKNSNSLIDFTTDKHRIILYDTSKTYLGLGFVIAPSLVDHIERQWKIDDRISIITFKKILHSKFAAFINIHSPHSGRPTQEIEEFYEILNKTISDLSKKYSVFILGDFNAQVGKQIHDEKCIGSYPRGKRNTVAPYLIELCLFHDFILTNTTFKHRAAHITTYEKKTSI